MLPQLPEHRDDGGFRERKETDVSEPTIEARGVVVPDGLRGGGGGGGLAPLPELVVVRGEGGVVGGEAGLLEGCESSEVGALVDGVASLLHLPEEGPEMALGRGGVGGEGAEHEVVCRGAYGLAGGGGAAEDGERLGGVLGEAVDVVENGLWGRGVAG